jgi:hypothetical protein
MRDPRNRYDAGHRAGVGKVIGTAWVEIDGTRVDYAGWWWLIVRGELRMDFGGAVHGPLQPIIEARDKRSTGHINGTACARRSRNGTQ